MSDSWQAIKRVLTNCLPSVLPSWCPNKHGLCGFKRSMWRNSGDTVSHGIVLNRSVCIYCMIVKHRISCVGGKLKAEILIDAIVRFGKDVWRQIFRIYIKVSINCYFQGSSHLAFQLCLFIAVNYIQLTTKEPLNWELWERKKTYHLREGLRLPFFKHLFQLWNL